MKKLKLVAALIDVNDSILIAQRLHVDLNEKWEFPNGEVHSDERDREVIYNNILEKFNISVRCDYLVCERTFKYPDCEVEIKLYHCTYLSGEVVLKTHSSYVFVDKSLLLTYDLTPIDRELAQYVVSTQAS